MNKLAFFLRSLFHDWPLAIGKLAAIIRRLCRASRCEGSDRDCRAARTPCVPINDPAYVRPDPLIYDQYYLMSLGFAVTWNNPDIQLFDSGGNPVSPSDLKTATTYRVDARIWNGSSTCPVVDMPVYFSYLSFGIGTEVNPIANTTVNLGVKGGPNHPAFASVLWTTPATPGHYCLQVFLDPPDDSNRLNNLGQDNTEVRKAQSAAVFTFALRNDTQRRRRYAFEVDAYTLEPPPPCDDRGDAAEIRRARPEDLRRGRHPVPQGWQVAFAPATPTLAPFEAITIRATVEPPPGFTGSQAFNVNAFVIDEEALAGGVTLTVVAGP